VSCRRTGKRELQAQIAQMYQNNPERVDQLLGRRSICIESHRNQYELERYNEWEKRVEDSHNIAVTKTMFIETRKLHCLRACGGISGRVCDSNIFPIVTSDKETKSRFSSIPLEDAFPSRNLTDIYKIEVIPSHRPPICPFATG